MNSISNWIATAPFEPVVTGVAAGDMVIRNSSSQWVNKPTYGVEVALNTPVAGANDTAIGTSVQKYSPFTCPSASSLYKVTGIEWLNGTVVANNTMSFIVGIDANPPSGVWTNTVAWGRSIANSGASAVQRCSSISGGILEAGVLYAAVIVTDSATHRYGTTTVGSANLQKAIAYAVDQVNGNSTAWTATTEQAYIKVYGRPIL